MGKNNSPKRKETIELIGTLVGTITALVFTGLGTIHVFNFLESGEIKNENTVVLIIVFALSVELVGIHSIIHAILHKDEMIKRTKGTQVFGFHLCNRDPEHCFKLSGKPLPLCSRHIGFYGAIVVIGLGSLNFPDFWNWVTHSLSWQNHITIAIIFIIANVAEGGLGKNRNIKSNNPIRCTMGVLAGLAMAFIGMSTLLIIDAAI